MEGINAKHIFIVCGEPSGDLNAANLVNALKKLNPGVKISGVGGEALRKTGAEILCDIKGLSVMGLFDVLKKLPKFFALKKLILRKISEEKPSAIILVDFSGFNLRLAKAINKKIPVIYYVSPQVWASRTGRIEAIKKYISKMIVIFKFEEEFYKKYGVSVEFVGHPLLDIVKPGQEKTQFLKQCGLDEDKTTIALLPGSRETEIKNILPIMLKSALRINKKTNAQFVIARSPNVKLELYSAMVKNLPLEIKIISGKTYDCLNSTDFALVCSGTATLETAIMQKPFCVIYKMNLLNYLLYRPQVKVPYIGMVNIVAGKKIIPEFVQFGAQPKNIATAVLDTLGDVQKLSQMEKGLREVLSLLGPHHAADTAAKIISSQVLSS